MHLIDTEYQHVAFRKFITKYAPVLLETKICTAKQRSPKSQNSTGK